MTKRPLVLGVQTSPCAPSWGMSPPEVWAAESRSSPKGRGRGFRYSASPRVSWPHAPPGRPAQMRKITVGRPPRAGFDDMARTEDPVYERETNSGPRATGGAHAHRDIYIPKIPNDSRCDSNAPLLSWSREIRSLVAARDGARRARARALQHSWNALRLSDHSFGENTSLPGPVIGAGCHLGDNVVRGNARTLAALDGQREELPHSSSVRDDRLVRPIVFAGRGSAGSIVGTNMRP